MRGREMCRSGDGEGVEKHARQGRKAERGRRYRPPGGGRVGQVEKSRAKERRRGRVRREKPEAEEWKRKEEANRLRKADARAGGESERGDPLGKGGGKAGGKAEEQSGGGGECGKEGRRKRAKRAAQNSHKGGRTESRYVGDPHPKPRSVKRPSPQLKTEQTHVERRPSPGGRE